MSVPPYGEEVARLGARLRFQHFMLLRLLGEGSSMRMAAALLNVTQPALSRTLREIEDALDAKLFTRTSRGLEITAKGQSAARAAARLLEDLGRVKQEVHLSASNSVLIRIGAPHFIAHGHLPSVIARLRRSPEFIVHAEVHECAVPELFSELAQGRLDALVTTYAGIPARILRGLEREPLFPSHFVVAAPAFHAMTQRKGRVGLAELVADSWILPSAKSMLRREVDAAFLRAGLACPAPVVESSNPVTNLKLVEAGVGLSLLPERTVQGMDTSGVRLLNVFPKLAGGPVALFHHSSEPEWRIAILREALGIRR